MVSVGVKHHTVSVDVKHHTVSVDVKHHVYYSGDVQDQEKENQEGLFYPTLLIFIYIMTRNARSGRTTSVRLTGDLGVQVGEAVAWDLINRVKIHGQ